MILLKYILKYLFYSTKATSEEGSQMDFVLQYYYLI